jgi:hypothetical protein
LVERGAHFWSKEFPFFDKATPHNDDFGIYQRGTISQTYCNPPAVYIDYSLRFFITLSSSGGDVLTGDFSYITL